MKFIECLEWTDQIFEDGFFVIKGKLFEDNSGKKIQSFGITSKNINEFQC